MKKSLLILSFLALFLGQANAQSHDKVASYGEKITAENAIEADKIKSVLGSSDSVHTKVAGIVQSVCKKKGCWMKMDIGEGETMMVRFYEYGFFLPKDCEGKKVVLDGSAFVTVITVDELKHYASDAGKSKEEIDNITEEQRQIAFEATGVLLYNE